MEILLTILKKYWPVFAVLGLLWGYGHHEYKRGYADREAVAVTHERDASEAAEKAFKAQVAEAEKKQNDAQAAADAAEQKAAEFHRKADTFYANWQEARKNVQLTIDADPGYTVGFVGLFNLGLQGGSTTGSAEVPDIARAAGLAGSIADADLSQAAGIQADDILNVIGFDGKIMQQCLSDRALMKSYLEKLHVDGFFP